MWNGRKYFQQKTRDSNKDGTQPYKGHQKTRNPALPEQPTQSHQGKQEKQKPCRFKGAYPFS